MQNYKSKWLSAMKTKSSYLDFTVLAYLASKVLNNKL